MMAKSKIGWIYIHLIKKTSFKPWAWGLIKRDIKSPKTLLKFTIPTIWFHFVGGQWPWLPKRNS